MEIQIQLPDACRTILSRLTDAGHRAYAVGGCVRDNLLGRAPHDWDIATDARPAETQAVFRDFPVIETGIRHGTVTVLLDGEPYEITTFRVDGRYSDGRRPDSVSFAATIEEDLSRRDFTVNAMAYSETDGLVDPFGGRQDLRDGLLRCVGDPETRFSEDALRLFRAVRFAAELGFSLEPETRRALDRLHGSISRVAKERIFAELKKLLTAPHAADALRICPALLFSAVPELAVLRDVPQHSRYHIYDVFEHTLHALDAAPPDETVRLAVLLHDTGRDYLRRRARTVATTSTGTRSKRRDRPPRAAKPALVTTGHCARSCGFVELHDLHFSDTAGQIPPAARRRSASALFTGCSSRVPTAPPTRRNLSPRGYRRWTKPRPRRPSGSRLLPHGAAALHHRDATSSPAACAWPGDRRDARRPAALGVIDGQLETTAPRCCTALKNTGTKKSAARTRKGRPMIFIRQNDPPHLATAR